MPSGPDLGEARFLLRDGERVTPASRRYPMQMVLIVFRSSLEDEVLGVLDDEGVRAFTVLPQALGVGQAGRALHSFQWPGFNIMILAALDELQASRLVERLAAFRDDSAARQRGAVIPLRVFVLPCVEVV